jgi:uncharacterized protein YecE (DUF72 family)
MSISVGCSGWSYDDWVGKFYPMDLAKKRNDWFSFYASYFNSVEINSTFYRPPNEFMVNSWVMKAKAHPGFEYSVKMPKLVTHESMVKDEVLMASEQALSFERICIKPLAREGMIGSVLLQLSPYFKNDSNSQKTLASVLDAVDCSHIDYSVEFRHRSWLDESGKEIVSDVADLLKERNVAIVLVDGPGFPITHRETADHSYVRFHGRNYDIWYTNESESDQRLNRYDYLYTKEQLQAWVPRIREAAKDLTRVRVFFNNHGRSKAVRNAFDMMDLLQIEHKSREIKIQNQKTLP